MNEWDRLEARWAELDEAQRQDDYPRAMRRQSRTAAVLALLALVVFTGCYIVVKGGAR